MQLCIFPKRCAKLGTLGHDFAKTPHEGLDEQVEESLNLLSPIVDHSFFVSK